ncbi:MAG: NfeD family protein [Deltaproteobacteria bacterium]|nr:NfeD family protein [Deltaproteobacteria bacterium]
MEWWLWIVVGIVLLGAEMLVPGGLFMLFFGVGAIIVGIVVACGFAQSEWMQWGLFSIASIAMLLLLRQRLLIKLWPPADHKEVDSLIGQIALPTEVIAPGASGKVELRGSAWNAHNASSSILQKGQRCKVQRVDGLTLHIVNDKNS